MCIPIQSDLRTPRAIYIAEKNGEPTKYNLTREAIDLALSMSWDQNSFTTMMRAQRYVFSFNPNRKYATVRSVNAARATELYRLGEDFDRPAILQRLAENREYDLRRVQSRYNDSTNRISPVRGFGIIRLTEITPTANYFITSI